MFLTISVLFYIGDIELSFTFLIVSQAYCVKHLTLIYRLHRNQICTYVICLYQAKIHTCSCTLHISSTPHAMHHGKLSHAPPRHCQNAHIQYFGINLFLVYARKQHSTESLSKRGTLVPAENGTLLLLWKPICLYQICVHRPFLGMQPCV